MQNTLSSIILFTLLGYGVQRFEKCKVLDEAVCKARESGKPLLNAGCGYSFSPAIAVADVNLDLKVRNVPRFVLASIEEIPFPDRYFGAVFCSHVIEHVDDYEKAMNELYRVADSPEAVFIIVPGPLWLTNWLHPDHKRVFIGNRVLTWQR